MSKENLNEEQHQDQDDKATFEELYGTVDDHEQDEGKEQEQEEKKTPEDEGSGKDEEQARPDQQKQQVQEKSGADSVPIGRFNDVYRRSKEQERLIEELQAQIDAGKEGKSKPEQKEEKPQFDPVEAEREYLLAYEEGDFDKAVSIRSQINAHFKEQAKQDAIEEMSATTKRERQEAAQLDLETRVQEVASDIVKQYPVLDEGTKEAKALLDEITEWRDYYITAKNIPADKALLKAAGRVMGDGSISKEQKVDDTPKDTRTKDAVRRNLADSKRQPQPMTGSVGSRAAGSMAPVDQNTWDKLTEEQRKAELM